MVHLGVSVWSARMLRLCLALMLVMSVPAYAFADEINADVPGSAEDHATHNQQQEMVSEGDAASNQSPASEAPSESPTGEDVTEERASKKVVDIVYDKADFYAEGALEEELSTLTTTPLYPMMMSDELKYFGQFESGDYDQGFSPGDGYHALGAYQFDNRYGLQDFMVACYKYDSQTYSMFEWLTSKDVDLITAVIYDNEKKALTEIGKRAEDSWHKAYKENPDNFAGLQECWQYETYVAPAINYLERRGLNMEYRRDCVKGLAGGMNSLFGPGGWLQFVGGNFANENFPGAGLRGNMSDVEFVTTLCNYVVDNIPRFYPNQPQYHQGWQNRYRKELQVCLEFLQYPTDVDRDAWYVTNGAFDYAVGKGIMSAYDNGRFGPDDSLTRGQVITILWRCSGEEDRGLASFSDVARDAYFAPAVAWGVSEGLVSGRDNNTFGPNEAIKREDLAVFLQRFAVWRNPEVASFNQGSLRGFGDSGRVNDYARDSLAWCVDKGLISGVSSGGSKLLLPQNNATRASMTSLMMGMFKDVFKYPSDVEPMEWYAMSGSYDYATSSGLILGYENGLFGPYDNLTRGQVLTILWRAEGEPFGGCSRFSDVLMTTYYGPAIAWGVSEGIVAGYADGTFRPDAPVTREDLAVFLQRYATWKNPSSASFDRYALDTYFDEAQVSGYAYDSLAWCVDKEMISGVKASTGQTLLKPQDTAWRASMASMMMMLEKRVL